MTNRKTVKLTSAIEEFLRLESASGLLLMAGAALAMVVANTPLDWLYAQFLETNFAVSVGEFQLRKPLLLWINDGLMAVFFLLVGLELKREVMEGELSQPQQIVLPVVAAVGGLVVPALVYWFFNRGNPVDVGGWAIPTATDIAFALGVLSLLGSRVPVSLKIFLTTIAIVDDLAAILIIAVFYSGDLSTAALVAAAIGIAALFGLNRARVQRPAAYLLVGIFIWVAVLKSGIHATLAGVVTALFIPLRPGDPGCPSRKLEHLLHPWVAFGILPLFAFANAGIMFAGFSWDVLRHGVPIGIFLGLTVGKQIGVFGMTVLVVKLGFAERPKGCNWRHLYGVSLLTGVGFTMSLFIGTLAFEHGEFIYDSGVKLAVLGASVICALLGWAVLRSGRPAEAE